MALNKSQLKKLIGLTPYELITCLLDKQLIIVKNEYNFVFKNEIYNDKYLIKIYSSGKIRTLWKHEATDFLLAISRECKKNGIINIKPSFMSIDDLPFIRDRKYIISIEKCTQKTMIFDSELGKFFTKKFGKRALIEEKEQYIIIMNEKTTRMEKI